MRQATAALKDAELEWRQLSFIQHAVRTAVDQTKGLLDSLVSLQTERANKTKAAEDVMRAAWNDINQPLSE